MAEHLLQGSESPNLVGQRVGMAAADHIYAEQEGVVIRQAPCDAGEPFDPCDCGYDDLIVQLDDGTITRVYEPEAVIVKPEEAER